jgi:multicomponent Na+:H+ antiporter subunit D
VEAAYKYFYISILAGVFLLLAAGCLYAAYGTLNVADLAGRIAATPDAPLAGVALVCLLAYCFVKSAVVPFHFWQPDFHTAAPTPVHAVLSSVVVKLGVVWLLRMTTVLFPLAMEPVSGLLVALGVVGIFFGGWGATGTYDAKRMLAYSTMGQIGFILVGIGWGTPLAIAAAIVYAVNHSLAKAALLMLAGSVASRAPVKTAKFAAITGLGRAMPLGGALFLLGGMALAGVPVSNGFISKLLVFQSGVAAGQLATLAVMGVGSLVSLVYVGRAFQRIWWAELPADVKPKADGDRLIAPVVLVAACLALGVWAEPLVWLATETAQQLLEPAAYVQAVLGD